MVRRNDVSVGSSGKLFRAKSSVRLYPLTALVRALQAACGFPSPSGSEGPWRAGNRTDASFSAIVSADPDHRVASSQAARFTECALVEAVRPAETTLETERLLLEALRGSHADELFESLADERPSRFIRQEPPVSTHNHWNALKARWAAAISSGTRGSSLSASLSHFPTAAGAHPTGLPAPSGGIFRRAEPQPNRLPARRPIAGRSP